MLAESVLVARLIPPVVPSNCNAAVSEAASTYAWLSFLTMYIRPMSTAKPSMAIMATRQTPTVTKTNPRSRGRACGTVHNRSPCLELYGIALTMPLGE